MKRSILWLLLIMIGCDPYDSRLKIVNHYSSKISVDVYPDSIPEFPSVNKTAFYYRNVINPSDTLTLIEMGRAAWESAISTSSNRRLNIIVYSIDSLDKYKSIDTLIWRKKYIRFSVSKESLEETEWFFVVR